MNWGGSAAIEKLRCNPGDIRLDFKPHAGSLRDDVVHTAELATNSLVDFVVFWNSDVHTVFHTAGYIDSSTIICFHSAYASHEPRKSAESRIRAREKR